MSQFALFAAPIHGRLDQQNTGPQLDGAGAENSMAIIRVANALAAGRKEAINKFNLSEFPIESDMNNLKRRAHWDSQNLYAAAKPVAHTTRSFKAHIVGEETPRRVAGGRWT